MGTEKQGLVEKFRINRRGATVIFTQFALMKHKFSNSLFCCFEGDDSKYYFRRIEDNTGYSPDNLISLNCSGKKEVLRLYRLISDKSEYKEVKVCYFVDRDFDKSIKEELTDIYETPCYSVENLYTTTEAFTRILRSEFNYSDADKEYEILLERFKNRQQDFHTKTLLFNSWLACQRDLSTEMTLERVNVSSFKLSKIIKKIDLDEVDGDYDKAALELLFPTAIPITDDMLKQKISEFQNINQQQIFRGKFEIDFLNDFIEAIKSEYSSEVPRLEKKSGFCLSQSKVNMLSEFSQYASTTPCLVKYLAKFSKVA